MQKFLEVDSETEHWNWLSGRPVGSPALKIIEKSYFVNEHNQMNFWDIFQFSYDSMILCYLMVLTNPLWHNATGKTADRHNCKNNGMLSHWHLWLSLRWKFKLFSIQRNRKSWMYVFQINKTMASSWLYCYFLRLILLQA